MPSFVASTSVQLLLKESCTCLLGLIFSGQMFFGVHPVTTGTADGLRLVKLGDYGVYGEQELFLSDGKKNDCCT
jgi:hypothetical protein